MSGSWLVNRELESDREVWVGVPADAERHVHVLSRVELGDDRATAPNKAVAHGEGDVGVVGVQSDRAGLLVRRRAAVQLKIDRRVLRETELGSGGKREHAALQRQRPD